MSVAAAERPARSGRARGAAAARRLAGSGDQGVEADIDDVLSIRRRSASGSSIVLDMGERHIAVAFGTFTEIR